MLGSLAKNYADLSAVRDALPPRCSNPIDPDGHWVAIAAFVVHARLTIVTVANAGQSSLPNPSEPFKTHRRPPKEARGIVSRYERCFAAFRPPFERTRLRVRQSCVIASPREPG
jgi:hypothetical protein